MSGDGPVRSVHVVRVIPVVVAVDLPPLVIVLVDPPRPTPSYFVHYVVGNPYRLVSVGKVARHSSRGREGFNQVHIAVLAPVGVEHRPVRCVLIRMTTVFLRPESLV